MEDGVLKKPNVHDEPLFESLRRIATLHVIPPLSAEQVQRQIETYATRGMTRSYRKFSGFAFFFIACLAIQFSWSEPGKVPNLTAAGIAFAGAIAVTVMMWRGNRVAMAASLAFMAALLVRQIALTVTTASDGRFDLQETVLGFGILGFFLHVFAAALQIEIVRRRIVQPPVTPA